METYKTMKKVVVLLDNEKHEVEIDSDVFTDYGLEACTRVIERLVGAGDDGLPGFLFCEEITEDKLPARLKFGTYNTYKLIINAGFHEKAENLRVRFLKEMNVDLAEEPIKSKFN
jgi:hypothetical protein